MGAKNSAVIRVILSQAMISAALGFVVGGVLAVGMRAAMAHANLIGRAVPRPLRRDARRHDRDVLVRVAALDRQGPPPRPRVGLQRLMTMTALAFSHSTTRSPAPRAASRARAPRRHRQDLRQRRARRRRAHRRDARHPPRRGHADRRAVGLGQDDADLDPRPAAAADDRARSGSKARTSPGSASASCPALRARNFGFVFQGFNLFPALTALENVAIAIQMKDPKAKDPRGEAKRLARARRAGAARASPAGGSLGRPEAARRDRARARRQPADPRRRRADRRTRYQDRAVGDGATARARELARPRGRRRHSRSSPRALCRSRRPRRGRPHFSIEGAMS